MTEILMQYGLFLAKAATVLIVVWLLIVLFTSYSRRGRKLEVLEIQHLNEKYRDMALVIKQGVLPKNEFKKAVKAEKTRLNLEKQSSGRKSRKRVFVLNFHGDLKATAVSSLREEISALLSLATPEDEVLLRLENAGGLVHEHGLAASQLQRIRDRNIPLTIAVDKVAASGGYMMACVGNRILAAPFAVLGSIGVLAQIPNFHRLLDQHGIEFEQIKAGEYKRTITLFGENTDKERAKMQESLDDLHTHFKEFVMRYRPGIDVARVATGEHWHAVGALGLGLIDELLTSDDYLLAASTNAELYEITYTAKKTLPERLIGSFQSAIEAAVTTLWHRLTQVRLLP
jgi:serine protease SohB